jgi:hypothetical protein
MHEAWINAWHTLVHVCRKWRNVVFGSPRRLDLRLRCTSSTPVKEMLDVWPLFPIVIRDPSYQISCVDNIVAALGHNNRICELGLSYIPSSQFEKVLAAMQQPFPALTYLELQPAETAGVVPRSFLGGSAPRLQSLLLYRIPFPGLPKLLLSTTRLVHLYPWRIPDSGYISPEAMVTCLSVLTSLENLIMEFESPRCRPDRKTQHPPPPTRTILPILTESRFEGVGEYLEDLVAQIDAPLLDNLTITFFHQLIFDTPELTQFISRTLYFTAHDEVHVVFSDLHVSVTAFDGDLELKISCNQSDWQL